MGSGVAGDRSSRGFVRRSAPGPATAAVWPSAASIERDGTALAAKAAAQLWSAECDIEWRLTPVRPWWLPRRNHVMLASQFLHGEQAARAACEALLPLLPDGALRLALATQITDEARHCEAYERYLARLGDIGPRRPLLADAVSRIADWKGPAEGLVLATHVVLESEALAIQQDLVRDFPCPILQRICLLAGRDESRHLALGRILLRAADLPARPIDERLALHHALHRLWQDCAQAVVEDHGVILWRAVPRARLDAGWRRLQVTFRRVGLIGHGEARAFGAAEAAVPAA